MYTVKINGGWYLTTASRCVVRNGTFAEMIEAMKRNKGGKRKITNDSEVIF